MNPRQAAGHYTTRMPRGEEGHWAEARVQWDAWVANTIGGDEGRQKKAVDAAISALRQGKSAPEAANHARAAVGEPVQAVAVTPNASAAAFNVVLPDGSLRCRLCGSTPAAMVTPREHNGLIVMMRFKKNPGPYCRDCGLAVLRQMVNTTFVIGWLGMFSFFVAPVTQLVNLGTWVRLRRLGPPQHHPDSGAPLPAPLDPGKPLARRPGPYVYAGLVTAVVGWLAFQGVGAGGCLTSKTSLANSMVTIHDARIARTDAAFLALKTCPDRACYQHQAAEIATAYSDFDRGVRALCFPVSMNSQADALKSADLAVVAAATAVSTAPSGTSLGHLGDSLDARINDADIDEKALNSSLDITTKPAPSTSP